MKGSLDSLLLVGALAVGPTTMHGHAAAHHVSRNVNPYRIELSVHDPNVLAVDAAVGRIPHSPEITADLVQRMIVIESSWKPAARGAAGERGLMQIQKPVWDEVTARLYGEAQDFDLAFDSQTNVEVGIGHLQWIREYVAERCKWWNALPLPERQKLIVAGHNTGVGNLRKAEYDVGRVCAQTRRYLEKLQQAEVVIR